MEMGGNCAGQKHEKDNDDGVTGPNLPTPSTDGLGNNMSTGSIATTYMLSMAPIETRDSHLPSLRDMTSRESTSQSK
jgi:hypothetical protein